MANKVLLLVRLVAALLLVSQHYGLASRGGNF
jgi:hypothetical protein